MRDDDREVLAVVAQLNNTMGRIVLTLLSETRPDGSLSPLRLRELAAICDDMSALLDNHADKLEQTGPVIIPGRDH
jgi:hypothetical protein